MNIGALRILQAGKWSPQGRPSTFGGRERRLRSDCRRMDMAEKAFLRWVCSPSINWYVYIRIIDNRNLAFRYIFRINERIDHDISPNLFNFLHHRFPTNVLILLNASHVMTEILRNVGLHHTDFLGVRLITTSGRESSRGRGRRPCLSTSISPYNV